MDVEAEHKQRHKWSSGHRSARRRAMEAEAGEKEQILKGSCASGLLDPHVPFDLSRTLCS